MRLIFRPNGRMAELRRETPITPAPDGAVDVAQSVAVEKAAQVGRITYLDSSLRLDGKAYTHVGETGTMTELLAAIDAVNNITGAKTILRRLVRRLADIGALDL